MPAASLPAKPGLEQLKKQARALQRAVRSGGPAAVRRVAEHHPDGAEATLGRFALSAAQLVVAREYGFASWPRLKEHVESSPSIRGARPLPATVARVARWMRSAGWPA